MKGNIRLGQKASLKPKLKAAPRIKFASFLELKEEKFSRYIAEVEADPVFRKLLSPDNAGRRVVTCKPFPRAVFAINNLPLEEQVSRDGSSVDVEVLLSESGGTADLIRKIGLDNFERFFIRGERPAEVKEICRECGISETEFQRVNDFINDLAVRSEFFHPSGLADETRISYTKLAELEYDGKSGFVINYFSPKYASGRYIVNIELLKELKKQKAFSSDELSGIGGVLEKIELINARKSTIYQIIAKIAEVQKNYLYSGDEKFLVPYTQKQLAKDIGIDSSVVCRAVFGRSLVTPHKVEKPLKFFVSKQSGLKQALVKKIIESRPGKLSDSDISGLLKEKFNMSVPRRTVNAYRNELRRQGRGS
jgi:hypothetical protein